MDLGPGRAGIDNASVTRYLNSFRMATWLPLVGVVLLFATLCWRSWWQHHRYGSHGVLLFRSGRWQEKLRAGLGVVLFVALAAQAVVAAVSPRRLEPVLATDERAAGIWH